MYQNYPVQDFQHIHLQNCKNLPTRVELLHELATQGTVAEIGVSKGDFAQLIFDISQPKKLYLIDNWADKGILYEYHQIVKEKFDLAVRENKVELFQQDSVIAMSSFEDNYFDWVYLDTYHLLENTRKELRAIAPKIKPNGVIAGHDYTKGNWNRGLRYGVKEAVREFCIQEHWEMIYLTHELKDNGSFAIRKIDPK